MDKKNIVIDALDAAHGEVVEAIENTAGALSPRYRLFEHGAWVAEGPDAVSDRLQALYSFLEEPSQQVDGVVREGDIVVLRWTVRGKRTGEFLGVPPDGAEVSFSGITWHQMDGDQIGDTWMSWDRLELLEQINAPAAAAQA